MYFNSINYQFNGSAIVFSYVNLISAKPQSEINLTLN